MKCFFGRHCILSRIIRKDLKFFHVLLIFSELGKDLTHLAHKENKQSVFSGVGQAKIFYCILFSWSSDIQHNVPSPMVEILPLWSPQKLLKNLGALSEYAINAGKVRPKF